MNIIECLDMNGEINIHGFLVHEGFIKKDSGLYQLDIIFEEHSIRVLFDGKSFVGTLEDRNSNCIHKVTTYYHPTSATILEPFAFLVASLSAYLKKHDQM